MAQRSAFFDAQDGDRSYDAAAFARVFESLAPRDGIVAGIEDELEVVESSPAAMTVEVSEGVAWIQGRYYQLYSSPKVLTVPAADSTNDRIDRVVVRLDLSTAARTISVAYVEGTAASSPTAPSLTRNSETWELSLAQILVEANSTEIENGDITDERGDTTLCGAIRMMTDDENAYWMDQAALLDPLAYEFHVGDSIDETVPAGETWYAINLWHIDVGTSDYLFQRVCDARRPVILPEGTRIKADGSQLAFAYICKPKSAFDEDPRYHLDARSLYYGRLERLKDLDQYDLVASIAEGSSQNTTDETNFPTDFDNGLIVLASAHDVSWLTLNNAGGGMNLQNEISDDHQIRFAEAILCPFVRTDFPSIKVRSANVTGDTEYIQRGRTSITLTGAEHYTEAVAFTRTFDVAPNVVATFEPGTVTDYWVGEVSDITTSGFNLRLHTEYTGTGTASAQWMAVGEKFYSLEGVGAVKYFKLPADW